MWCCMSFCENSRVNLFSKKYSKSLDVTFHAFPTIQWLRQAWLASLGMEENHLTTAPVICSRHFKDDDFQPGTCILKSDAVPTAVQVCITCLDTTTELYKITKYNLADAYSNVTGLLFHNMLRFTPMLCMECSKRLANCNQFRNKSLRAHHLLLQFIRENDSLTAENVKTIKREDNKLTSNITKKTFEPDHCDFYFPYYEEKDVETLGIENVEVTIDKTEIKIENEENEESEMNGFDRDIEFPNAGIEIVVERLNDTHDNQNVEVIKIDRDNIEDFINNEDFMNVKFPNDDIAGDDMAGDDIAGDDDDEDDDDDDDDDDDIDFSEDDNVILSSIIKRTKNGKVVKKSTVTKKVNAKNVTIKKVRKKLVKSDIRGRPGRKPGFKEELKLFKVTELTHEEQLAEIQKRKDTANFKNSPYKCTICYKGFCDINAYNRHMDKHTNKFGQFACPICGLHTKNTYRVNKHLGNTHAARYNCTMCPFVTRSRNSAKAHERWHDGKKYKCPHCEEEFIKSTSYMSHVRIKHPSDFVCTLCGFSFIGARGLRMHMNMKHRFDDVQNPDGPSCEECDIRFASETAYHQHMKVSPKHATVDTFKLNYPVRKVCRRNQPRPAKSGKREAGPAPKTIGPMDCEQCGIKLKGSRSYAMHFKKYHPDKNRTKFPKAKIMCEQCGKIFTCMAHLRYHMPIHAEQRQFKCNICDKRFAFKANLMNHVVIHDESRPRFECTVCGKNFSNQQNRWRHMFLHKGIKFKCEICDKSFNTDPQRALHVAHVHMKVPWPKRHRGPRPKAHRARHAMYTSDSQDS